MKRTLSVVTFSIALFIFHHAAAHADTSVVKRDSSRQEGMNNLVLNQLINENATVVSGTLGYWEVKYGNRQLLIITDEQHNRMRIITPIIEEKKLKKDDYVKILSADFDKALDVKYALYKEVLWSVFTHPLRELSDGQFLDAMKQVKTLADNYGSTYSSSDLIFGEGK